MVSMGYSRNWQPEAFPIQSSEQHEEYFLNCQSKGNVMTQPVDLSKVFPLYKVERDCILSKLGDVTLAYEATLPEIFSLSDQEYEGLHQILIKAIKVLPANSVFHKQDWFYARKHTADFQSKELTFLSQSSER